MIVPSVDILGGRAVQLVGGDPDGEVLDCGDPVELAARFGVVGEVAVIDLDAALGRGSNAGVIGEMLGIARCRVGGGVRDVDAAVGWLDRGAAKVILGTAARPEVLRELPRDRVIAALDAKDGEVVTEGWTTGTGARVEERIDELQEFVGGFLVTFVEREGRMEGLPWDRVKELAARAEGCRLTVAGGVKSAGDIAEADGLGCDAQVGMGLYTGRFTLAEGVTCVLRSDRGDGLWPTVVCDEGGVCLGLVYSNGESVARALETGRGVYWSRSRGGLWEKGKTSGDVQELVRIDVDCDRDALRFTVKQHGRGFCHLGTRTCFGAAEGLSALEATVAARVADAPAGSYTRRLLDDDSLLRAKLVEEAGELGEAVDAGHVAEEVADVVYFAMVKAAKHGVGLADVAEVLDRRALKVTRRKGDAKPGAIDGERSGS